MSDYDGLHVCEVCGDAYTTGRLCTNCAHQKMIDDAESSPIEEPWDDLCQLEGHDWQTVIIFGEECEECQRCGVIDC